MREFIRPFMYSLSTIMMLFMMQILIRLLPLVLQRGIPASIVIELFAVNLVHIAVLSVPMSLLISMLMVFGKLSANNELTAIKAGGKSIVSLLPPVVAVSGFISVIMLFFNTTVLPEANHHGSVLRSDIMRKKPAALITPKVLIKDFPGYALMVDSVEAETGRIFGIKIFSEEEGNKPTVTVAESGTIFMTRDESNIELTLFNGETHTSGARGTNEHYQINFEEQVIFFKNINSDLTRSERESRGDREKTNEILLDDVARFRTDRDRYIDQHQERVDELLLFIDSIMVPEQVDTLVSGDSSPPEDTVLVDSAELAMTTEEDSSDAINDSTNVELQVDEEENDSSLATTNVVLDTTGQALALTKAFISDVENQSSGRRFDHISRSETTRARIRSTRIERENEKINGSLVEVHKKYALAAAAIIFALLGVPLGVISRSGSVAISVVYSLVFFIIYYAFLMVGENLSENFGVPPAVAMWIGNLILFIIAIFLTARVVRETSLINWGAIRLKHGKSLKVQLIALIICGIIILVGFLLSKKYETAFQISQWVGYGVVVVVWINLVIRKIWRVGVRYGKNGISDDTDSIDAAMDMMEQQEVLHHAEKKAAIPGSKKRLNPFVLFFKNEWEGIKRIAFLPSTIMRKVLPILPGYILGRFFSFFFTVTFSLMVLTVVIDFISNVDTLQGGTGKEFVEYYIYFMAWFLSIIIPMALLLATMLTIGSFARTNELTAIKAAGISMVKMTIPLLFVGIFMSFFSFYFTEKLLPEANARRAHMEDVFSARRNGQPEPDGDKIYKHDFYYFSDPMTAYRFTHFQTLPPRGDKLTRYRFGEGTLLETTEIKKLIYQDSTWIMLDGIKRDFSSEEYQSHIFYREYDEYITDTPHEMVQGVAHVEEISYNELKSLMVKAKQRGEDVSRYEADLNFKFALPLMNFIVILIGVAVTARSDKRGGAVYFGAGLLLVLIYWVSSQFFLVFGRSGQIHPMVAAWCGTVIFLIIGLLLYRKASQ